MRSCRNAQKCAETLLLPQENPAHKAQIQPELPKGQQKVGSSTCILKSDRISKIIQLAPDIDSPKTILDQYQMKTYENEPCNIPPETTEA